MSTGDAAAVVIPADLRLPPGAGVIVGRTSSAGRALASTGATLDASAAVEIGSVTKSFTGLLVAVLATEGALALDDSVGRYLPEVDRYRSLRGVTLDELATHSAGLPRLPVRLLARSLLHPSEPYRGLDATRVVASAPRYGRARHAHYRYSNYGYMLLGEAAARAAGAPYGEALRRAVLEPLGLADTWLVTSADDVVRGVRRSGRPASAWPQPDAAGAGGLRSTLSDLLQFVERMLDPPPALRDAVRLAMTPRRRLRSRPLSVGLGWFTLERAGRAICFNNGATAGATSFVGATGRTGVAGVATVGALKALNEICFTAFENA